MSHKLSKKKIVLRFIIAGLPTFILLILGWYYLPRLVFGLALLGFMGLLTILQAVAKWYDERKSKRGRK
jgi:hypothetical protein